jgi:hypothetical protein
LSTGDYREPIPKRGKPFSPFWPKPNEHVTSRKVETFDFAEWAKDEAKEAESKMNE